MFAQGTIATAQISGVWRLTAEPAGMLRSEFIDWSYDVNVLGPIGTPMAPRTVTVHSTTIGHYTVHPDGTIAATLNSSPTDDSTDTPAPILFTCAEDTITQPLLDGTATHTRAP